MTAPDTNKMYIVYDPDSVNMKWYSDTARWFSSLQNVTPMSYTDAIKMMWWAEGIIGRSTFFVMTMEEAWLIEEMENL